MKHLYFLFCALILSNLAHAEDLAKDIDESDNKWFWGYGVLYSDFSDWTAEDAEASSLTFSKMDQKPLGLSVFTGVPINQNLDFEVAFEAHGRQESIGSASGATLKSVANTYGLYPSIILKPNNQFFGIKPYARLGFGVGVSETSTTKTNAVGVFSNPNNTNETRVGSHLIYGFGAKYKYSDTTSVRLEFKVNRDGQSDYINNIDNGYIYRDFRTIGLHLVHGLNAENDNTNIAPLGYSLGVFRGTSKTDARMSGGNYSGNIYNLTTGAVVTTVSGSMTDDKTDVSNRVMLFAPLNEMLDIEMGVVQYGTFKSRSSNLGITGGGNALTGAASRSVTSFETSLSYPVLLTSKFEISPSIGAGVFYVEDEIYNNLEFNGIGGTDRGLQSILTKLNLVGGIMGSYSLNEETELAIRYDYASNVGHSSGLGKGGLSSISLGIILNL